MSDPLTTIRDTLRDVAVFVACSGAAYELQATLIEEITDAAVALAAVETQLQPESNGTHHLA